MSEPLTVLKHPIALRNEHVASKETVIRVKQHSKSWSGGDFTISEWPAEESSEGTRLFSVVGSVKSLSQRCHVRDASGLPLFEIYRKRTGVTWFVELPGDNRSPEPIATFAPRWSSLKDKYDVYVKNASGGDEVVLEVRGQDIWKLKTHVYYNGNMVMVARRTDYLVPYIPGKRPEWKVKVAEGFDISLASLITVVLAQVLYSSSYPSSFSGQKPEP
ncbi:hypothetical protein DTO027B5_2415 [Paecilomyces variotii]|nr:hypothetical protein DTO169C6_2641 [Paecilomyces variotii]KAJ9288131.1 hypothetical protein DTO021C3_4304 [Paecilomyces variotii]KAJ9329057.1 hypothetical protein DTO027B3_457 [Paecilomyces variotii]KAJ9335822.1 hypothetical protein DTO027B5_2415 [Paecilomyces variotii]